MFCLNLILRKNPEQTAFSDTKNWFSNTQSSLVLHPLKYEVKQKMWQVVEDPLKI